MKLNLRRPLRTASSFSFKTRLLVYLLLLSSIPVALMGVISAYNASRIIRSHALATNSAMLKQTEKEMNTFFKKIDDLMIQYTYASPSMPPALKRFVEEDLSSANWKTTNDLGETLVKLQSGMEHVLELDFYSLPYGKILSSHGNLYTDRQFGDPLAVSEARKLTLANRWINLRMSIPEHPPADRPVLTILKPVIQNNKVYAALIVYLDATAISSYKLAPPDTFKGSAVFIADEKGNVLLHSDTSRIGTRLDEKSLQHLRQTENSQWLLQTKLSLEGVAYHATVLRSDTRAWYYVTAVPEKAFTAEPNAQRNIMFLISVGMVLAGLFISYRASRTIYRPLQALTSKLPSPRRTLSSGQDEVELLGKYLESMNMENEQLSRDLTRYFDHARHFLLHQLLVGNTPLTGSALSGQELFSGQASCIPLLLLDVNRDRMAESYSREDCSLFYYAVDNITREILGRYGERQVIMLEPGMFITVVPAPAPLAPDSLREMGQQVLDAIRRYLKLHVYIAVSCSYTGADGLHEAFEEASGLLRYRFIVGDNQVILTHDLEASISIQAEALFQYENDILVAIRERKWKEAESIFLMLTEALQESFSISEELLRCYFPQLLGSIIKAVRTLPQTSFSEEQVQRLLPQLAECRTLDEIELLFRESVFAVMLREYEEWNGAGQRVQLVRQVQDYIHNHYDSDLSLQQCAELVNLHTFDLSRLFKQVTGTNFIDYLIELRMQKAKEMLEDSQLKIQDIAEKLGYTSQRGFMRAFKKCTGLAPGQYRSKLRE